MRNSLHKFCEVMFLRESLKLTTKKQIDLREALGYFDVQVDRFLHCHRCQLAYVLFFDQQGSRELAAMHLGENIACQAQVAVSHNAMFLCEESMSFYLNNKAKQTIKAPTKWLLKGLCLYASFRFPTIRFDAPMLLLFSGCTHAHAKSSPVGFSLCNTITFQKYFWC